MNPQGWQLKLFNLGCDTPADGEPARTCRTCGEHKALRLFRVKSRFESGAIEYKSYCLDCDRQHQRVRKMYRHNGTYQRLWWEQGGYCAIPGCQVQLPVTSNGGQTLCLDHDHETGEARGLLCHNHNTAIGKFNDNPDELLQAVTYLTPKHPLANIITAYLDAPRTTP